MYNYSLGLYEKAFPKEMPLREKLAATKRCGYDHMEFCLDPEPTRARRIDWTEQQVREVRNMAEDIGIPFTTFSLTLLRTCPLGLLDKKENERAFEILKKGANIAAGLGSRVMLINGYDVYDEPSTPATRERFFENLSKIAEICACAGVMTGIENAEKEFCYSVRQARELADAAASPFIGVYADMGNSANSVSGDTEASMTDIRSGEGRIFSMHIKDTVPGEYRFTPYGQGHVNFDRAISLAKEMNIRLFTAELFYRSEAGAPEAVAKWVNQFIRGYF